MSYCVTMMTRETASLIASEQWSTDKSLDSMTSFKKRLLDLVQERLTFAGRVKLKRMDLCIECDGCYSACKDRHGTDRFGPRK